MRIVAVGRTKQGRRRYYTLALTRRGEVVFRKVPRAALSYDERFPPYPTYFEYGGLDVDGWCAVGNFPRLRRLGLLSGHPARVQNAIDALILMEGA